MTISALIELADGLKEGDDLLVLYSGDGPGVHGAIMSCHPDRALLNSLRRVAIHIPARGLPIDVYSTTQHDSGRPKEVADG